MQCILQRSVAVIRSRRVASATRRKIVILLLDIVDLDIVDLDIVDLDIVDLDIVDLDIVVRHLLGPALFTPLSTLSWSSCC